MDKHASVAIEIANQLSGYIGSPKRRLELAEEIAALTRAVEAETIERCAKAAESEVDSFICSYLDADEDGYKEMGHKDACLRVAAVIRALAAYDGEKT